MKTYEQLLDRVQCSPASRVSRMTSQLDTDTLEWTTTYVLILQNPRGEIIHQRIHARTLSMMQR